ncbi:hypothetical protein, partial [Endozoicomonas sp. ONNA2]|uniref:hypothetical protein n=1 Tax=Endozoicomonas sp. ONNA2 TaxID=2828741 RepID=UPI0021480DDE
MNPCQLQGLTPQQLYALIRESAVGFSAEGGSIQYLGRQIQLHDGITALSEQKVITAESKQLFARLVNLQPDLETELPGSKAEAIQRVAKNLVVKYRFGAIAKSPTREVQCAVFLECMLSPHIGKVATIRKLSEANSLSEAEKLGIMLAAEEKLVLPGGCWELVDIPLSIRWEKAKRLFQCLSEKPSLAEDHEITEQLFVLNPIVREKLFKVGLLVIRQIIESENNELSRQLLSEVDNIEKLFTPKAEESGCLSSVDDDQDFKFYTKRLLYLYAACSGFSQEADIAELTSYVRTVLYSTDAKNIWHIVKELAYLSKQPGSIGYCRYIDVVANILKVPATHVSLQFENLKQLSDINGFALLESKKTLPPYLKVLRANIDNMTPEYSQVLLDTVDDLECKFADISLPEDKPAIKSKVHRLLMIIAACKSSRQIMDTAVLARFVVVIMKHRNQKNIPYLIHGLARLAQSTPKIQQILGKPKVSGGDHLRLAPLQLLGFIPEVISEDEFIKLGESLHACGANKRRMKDIKVFHQWQATLEQVLVNNDMNKAMVVQILKNLTHSPTYDKLGWLHILLKIGGRFNKFLDSMGLSCQMEGLPLLIAEKGSEALVGINKAVSKWLLKQRHSHLLPFYIVSMSEYCDEIGNTEITGLIQEFIHSSANHTFIEARQSPLNNPHLQVVYQKYTQFKAGWRANFSNFSEETRNKLLSPGETLELTEDPWDLFISGLEVHS